MSSAIHVVDGPPGTGKTHFLSRQSERAAEKHGTHSIASPEMDHLQAYRYVSSGRRPTGWVPPIVRAREGDDDA